MPGPSAVFPVHSGQSLPKVVRGGTIGEPVHGHIKADWWAQGVKVDHLVQAHKRATTAQIAENVNACYDNWTNCQLALKHMLLMS